jgi:cell division protein FtsB
LQTAEAASATRKSLQLDKNSVTPDEPFLYAVPLEDVAGDADWFRVPSLTSPCSKRCQRRPMSTRQRKQSKTRPLLLPFFSLLVMGYFAYHAVEGDYGLFALGKLKDRVTRLETQLAAARAEREKMESHVSLMRPESLDRDMIDERAREALNMADAKDIVIFLAPEDRRRSR